MQVAKVYHKFSKQPSLTNKILYINLSNLRSTSVKYKMIIQDKERVPEVTAKIIRAAGSATLTREQERRKRHLQKCF